MKTIKELEACSGWEPYIFLSYSHKNDEQASEVIEFLQSKGYRIWFDQGINTGTDWAKVIAERLKKSKGVLSIITKEYFDSTNCMDELNFAKDKKKPDRKSVV